MDRDVTTITWQRALKVYWAQTWRGFLLAVALWFLMVLTYGFFSPLLRELIGIGEIVLRLALVAALGLYAFSWAMKGALQAQYSDFSIDKVPLAAPSSSDQPPAVAILDGWQALAVWWATFWRAVLVCLPLNVVGSYLILGSPLPGPAPELPRLLGLYALETIVGVAAGTWALRIALTLDYGTWRLQLVSKPA
jgi:hypothetical protein